MGWVEGALAEAGDLRGISTIMMDLFERPDWVNDLLEVITEVEIEFAVAQIKAGADIIGLGDAICSQISPEMYSEFALPYEKRIFDAIKKEGAIPRLHICGDTNALLPSMVGSGAAIIDLDWMVDINLAHEQHGDKISFCGNMDPVAVFLEGTKEEVYEATNLTVKKTKSKIISSAGCEIPIGTPAEILRSHNDALINHV
jgi:MtaA/CmuA family methyltransferase